MDSDSYVVSRPPKFVDASKVEAAVCHVVEEGCTSPPGIMPETLRRIPTCYRCGMSVCRKCSRVHKYLTLGRRRLCLYCIDEEAK